MRTWMFPRFGGVGKEAQALITDAFVFICARNGTLVRGTELRMRYANFFYMPNTQASLLYLSKTEWPPHIRLPRS
jgi:hypothetical protein